MSSDMKDARWQLAIDIAEEDGKSLYGMSYMMQRGYLDVAQKRLDSAWGAENVEALARRFRTEN
ncbi:hypothetical protein SEA_ALLEB_14 [Microbacterium phage Alleb]|nr:hypothetical protein SEA_ALLEB_14 [Microbacterium phage Alleb]